MALAAHGLLLLNDGVYSDGWLVHTYLQNGEWGYLWTWFENAGAPQTACFHWLIGLLPSHITCYKILVFLSIAGAAIAVYQLALRLGYMTHRACLFVALISLSYPAYVVSVELIVAPNSICLLLFLLGWLLLVGADTKPTSSSWIRRSCAILLLVGSFTTQSLLVFFYGFALLWLVHWRRSSAGRSFLHLLEAKHFWRLAVLLLPLGYWLLMRCVFFTPHGYYEGYTRLTVPGLQTLRDAFRFLQNSVYVTLNRASKIVLDRPTLWLAILPAAAIAWRILPGDREERSASTSSWRVLAYGILLLLLAFLPYALVGKSPGIGSWNTRHALLVSIPVALLIVGVQSLFSRPEGWRMSRLGHAVMVALLLAFCGSCLDYYVDWQARWVKDRAIMLGLASTEGVEDASVYWINDEFPLGRGNTYDYYEWGAMMTAVWGGDSRVGLDIDIYDAVFLEEKDWDYDHKSVTRNFDPAGKQLMLTIRAGPTAGSSGLGLSLRYFYHRFFAREEMDEFLDGIVSLEVAAQQ